MHLSPLLRRKLLLAVVSTVAAGVPALAPAIPAAKTVIRVAPAVRRIVRNLHRIDIPDRWRRRNWIGDRGQGSCVHASLVHLLHWQGRHELADWWQKRYANGETADGLAAKLENAGVRFAETRSGDETFLEWALRTRRGTAVVVQNGAHMVNLVGLDRQMARILDSNAPERIQEIPRAEFLREWKTSGGWAVTPVGTPPPPSPWHVQQGKVHRDGEKERQRE
jgi:hypothetical protein